MTDLQPGDTAPDFSLPDDTGQILSLSAHQGRPVIVYFYPKDDTPGCTTQACAFRDQMPAFEKSGAAVIGISRDSIAKHEKFKAKHDLNFPLLADEDGNVCELYGVWKEKNMYGRRYMGIERTSFLIDQSGIIRKIWRKVRVKGHIEAVQEALAAL